MPAQTLIMLAEPALFLAVLVPVALLHWSVRRSDAPSCALQQAIAQAEGLAAASKHLPPGITLTPGSNGGIPGIPHPSMYQIDTMEGAAHVRLGHIVSIMHTARLVSNQDPASLSRQPDHTIPITAAKPVNLLMLPALLQTLC